MIPQITSALNGWQQDITLITITQSVVDYETVNTESSITFKGVVQPLSPEQLKILPTEQRSWKNLQIHTKINLSLSTNDKVTYNGLTYKILAVNDYSAYNYYEYHLIEDYE